VPYTERFAPEHFSFRSRFKHHQTKDHPMNSLPPDAKSMRRAEFRTAPMRYLIQWVADVFYHAVLFGVLLVFAAAAAIFILFLNK
jgi:hypothetical protein